MKKTLALVLVLCMALSLFAGCKTETGDTSPSASNPPPSPIVAAADPSQIAGAGGLEVDSGYLADKVVVSCSSDGGSFNPYGRAAWGSVVVGGILFQKLLQLDTVGNIRYELAKSVDMIDELTYKITLWDCIYDSANNHFTADDVIWSIDKFVSEGNTGGVNRLDYLEKVNDYELIWHCKQAFSLGELGKNMGNPTMVCQASWEASKDEMTTTPVGTGPYVLKAGSYTPGSGFVFEVNEDFWMKALPEDVRADLWVYCSQNVKEIEYQVIQDASSRAIALEMGTISAADSLDATDVAAFANNPDISPILLPVTPAVPILFNCSDESFCSDINLRMAICYAIDNAAIADGVGCPAYPVYSLQPNMYDAPAEWTSGREYYDYSAAKAQEYLDKSSYNGELLTLLYTASSVAFSDTAILLQSQLKKLNINIDLRCVEQSVNQVDQYDPTAWDMRMDQFGGGSYCINTYKRFWSGDNFGVLQGKGITLIEDATLDELFVAMDADSNPETIAAFESYLTYDQCYSYGMIGFYNQTASRSSVNATLGDKGTLMPNAFTFN